VQTLYVSVENLDPERRYFGPIALLALIGLTPDEVERRTCVLFTHAVDDLGDGDFAAFATPSGVTVGMRYRDEDPPTPIEMFVDLATPHPQGWNALAESVLGVLGLAGPESAVIDNDTLLAPGS
jgi:hypothetical protein